MRVTRVLLLFITVTACAPSPSGRSYGGGSSASSSSSGGGGGSAAPDAAEVALAERILALTNNHRRAAGLPNLTWCARCADVAYAHARDMADRGYFDHVNPEGASAFDRLDNAGVAFTAAGENIAQGYSTPEDAMAAWMGSDGHRANILSPDFTELGVGVRSGATPGPWWTQVFRHP